MEKAHKVPAKTQPLPKWGVALASLATVGGIVLIGWIGKQWLLSGTFAWTSPVPAAGPAGFEDFTKALTTGLGALVGVLALAAIVVGGIFYMTSRGESKQIGVAKGIIVAALTGVALYMFSSWLIGWLKDIVQTYFKDIATPKI